LSDALSALNSVWSSNFAPATSASLSLLNLSRGFDKPDNFRFAVPFTKVRQHLLQIEPRQRHFDGRVIQATNRLDLDPLCLDRDMSFLVLWHWQFCTCHVSLPLFSEVYLP
jgi:hypothetical protein